MLIEATCIVSAFAVEIGFKAAKAAIVAQNIAILALSIAFNTSHEIAIVVDGEDFITLAPSF
jgi:hypothetical protein